MEVCQFVTAEDMALPNNVMCVVFLYFHSCMQKISWLFTKNICFSFIWMTCYC